MKIITSGDNYADIDMYGGIIAYAELLQKQRISAQAVSTAPLNDSIPPIVREWKVGLARQYQPSPDDTFTLIDISEPKYFEKFVTIDQVEAVIDHHTGFEDFWRDKIGDQACIEHVGAACTQVFEKWQQANLLGDISQTSARLLMCGILDNTLNFGATVTTKRDHDAYEALKQYADLSKDWQAVYFRACQEAIMKDLPSALKGDTKTPHFKTYPHNTAAGQLALWDVKGSIKQYEPTFKQVITAREPHWFMNAISISENKSYFITDVPEMQAWLSDLLKVTFKGNVAIADRMWLRKEILRADIENS